MVPPYDPDSPDGGYAVRDRRWWSPGGAAHDPEPSPRAAGSVAALEAELADRDRRLLEMTARVREGEREVEQIRARLERESARELERRFRDGLATWLAAVDDLDRAIAAGRAAGSSGPLLEGVELVRHNLLARLVDHGVRRIESVGRTFDPRVHEAIARVAVAEPGKDGLVLEDVQAGYTIGDEVLRPARVAVGALRHA